MTEPLFWLGLSLLLVAVSLTAVLVAALPAMLELARAARSAEKLFDTLRRELPPTLEAIRLTGLEISDLTDDISEGVESAGNVVRQVDRSLTTARRQVQEVNVTTRSVLTGFKAAWKTLTRPSPRRRGRSSYRSSDRLAAGEAPAVDYHASTWPHSTSAYEDSYPPTSADLEQEVSEPDWSQEMIDQAETSEDWDEA